MPRGQQSGQPGRGLCSVQSASHVALPDAPPKFASNLALTLATAVSSVDSRRTHFACMPRRGGGMERRVALSAHRVAGGASSRRSMDTTVLGTASVQATKQHCLLDACGRPPAAAGSPGPGGQEAASFPRCPSPAESMHRGYRVGGAPAGWAPGARALPQRARPAAAHGIKYWLRHYACRTATPADTRKGTFRYLAAAASTGTPPSATRMRSFTGASAGTFESDTPNQHS